MARLRTPARPARPSVPLPAAVGPVRRFLKRADAIATRVGIAVLWCIVVVYAGALVEMWVKS